MTHDDEPPPKDRRPDSARAVRPSRRTLLGVGAGLAATAAAAAFLGSQGLPEDLRHGPVKATRTEGEARDLSPRAWRTLSAVLDRLLPSEPEAPGASDVNAIGWLDAVLSASDLDADTHARVHDLAERMRVTALAAGATVFGDLEPAAQDDAIRGFEETWEDQLALRALLAYGLEALLGDPVHGINRGEVGWTWARHTPGYPRPPADWSPRGEGPGA